MKSILKKYFSRLQQSAWRRLCGESSTRMKTSKSVPIKFCSVILWNAARHMQRMEVPWCDSTQSANGAVCYEVISYIRDVTRHLVFCSSFFSSCYNKIVERATLTGCVVLCALEAHWFDFKVDNNEKCFCRFSLKSFVSPSTGERRSKRKKSAISLFSMKFESRRRWRVKHVISLKVWHQHKLLSDYSAKTKRIKKYKLSQVEAEWRKNGLNTC